MSSAIRGPISWKLTRDDEGYRTYKIKHRIECTSSLDGPTTVLLTPGLPVPGSAWIIGNDLDIWVWCRFDATVEPELTEEPNYWWTVEQEFSNKPEPPEKQKCQDEKTEDPLLEPQKVSGAFVKYNEEATHDRFKAPIVNSAHEQFRGPQVEFDKNRPTVKIIQNVAVLNLRMLCEMLDTVNEASLWGLDPRCLKLSGVSWDKKWHGQCFPYYTRNLEFDVNFATFDRDLLDEGTKVLKGHWNRINGHYVLANIGGSTPDPTNPTHFNRFKDRNNENTRVILNGAGLPAGVCIDKPGGSGVGSAVDSTGTGTGCEETTVGEIHVEKYHESNFLLLGIPITF